MNKINIQVPSYYINDEFNTETFKQVLLELDALPSDFVRIYISTPGGVSFMMDGLIDFLENRFEYVEFIMSGYVISAGWRMVMKTKFPVRVLPLTYGQDHLSEIAGYIGIKSSNLQEDIMSLRISTVKEDTKQWLGYAKEILGYTKKERKVLKKGGEVYFSRERIAEILEHRDKILGVISMKEYLELFQETLENIMEENMFKDEDSL